MTELTQTSDRLVARRYGAEFLGELAEATTVIEQQLRHRSVRKFTGEEVTDAELNLIVAAAQSGSTSSNLQAWSVVAVRDQDRKNRISEMLGSHAYIENCSVFLVWVADYHRDAKVIEHAHGIDFDTVGFLEHTIVAAVDSGITAQNALLAAESLDLGGVFVGSVRNNPLGVADELGLPDYVFPLFGLALGHPDPTEEADTKPRLPLQTVLHHEQYDTESWRHGTEEFEKRLADYYADYGKPEYSWARTLRKRAASVEGLRGRDQVRTWLNEKGLSTK